MRWTTTAVLIGSTAAFGLAGAVPAKAYRMSQNPGTGFVTSGVRVKCNDAGGFAHWNLRHIVWRVNPALEGATAGGAVDFAIAQWNGVAGSDFRLTRGPGGAAGGFGTDDTNSMIWAGGNGCSNNCLALTAVTLAAGQEIVESDITFNTLVTWSSDDSAYDIRAVAAHELGHSLGIHHSNVLAVNRPTMRSGYFANGRTLEPDDKDALLCAVGEYPVNCTQPCPAGGVYDSQNCYMWTAPPGTVPFLFDENMYHQPVSNHPNGPCPYLAYNHLSNTSIQPGFDTQNCLLWMGPEPNQLPFIWSNNYYLTPICRP